MLWAPNAARNTPLQQQTPHHTLHLLTTNIDHKHTHHHPSTGSLTWQTVLAPSTNGHFNALEVTGLVSGGHLHRPEFLICILQRGQCPRAGEVVDDATPPHMHTEALVCPLYAPYPSSIPQLPTRSLPPPCKLPTPISHAHTHTHTHTSHLSRRTAAPHPPFISGGSASHAELTRGTCWVWAHRIRLRDRGRVPQKEPVWLPQSRAFSSYSQHLHKYGQEGKILARIHPATTLLKKQPP